MADTVPGAAPVIDQRTSPRGVLPRSTQTWLMAGLAVGVLGIIVFAGHQEPTARPAAATPATTVSAPSPERLRDFQDRLRILDQRARQQAVNQEQPTVIPRPYDDAPVAAASATEASGTRRQPR